MKKIDKTDKRLYCTKMLLQNLQELRWHCEESVYSYEQLDEIEIGELMENTFKDPDVFLKSIVRSRQLTQIMMAHIERMLDKWEKTNRANHDKSRQRRIIRAMYMSDNPKTLQEISDQEKKSVKLIIYDLNIAYTELSALLFGSGGILKNVNGKIEEHGINRAERKAQASRRGNTPKEGVSGLDTRENISPSLAKGNAI